MSAIIDDTYAEAFKSMYSEVLITAVNRKWLDHAVNAATGNASSSILCDCEAGLDRYVGPGGDESVSTPDGRPGAIIQLHIPKFWKDPKKLEKAALVRISQYSYVPTASCFNLMEDSESYFKLGKKVAFFGNNIRNELKDLEEKCGGYQYLVANLLWTEDWVIQMVLWVVIYGISEKIQNLL